jgi:Protein of unknown function (DUF2934)
MNDITLATVTKTKPPESVLEHEIRLRAHDFYEQRGMADGHAPGGLALRGGLSFGGTEML